MKLLLILSNKLESTPVWVVPEFRGVIFQALKQSNLWNPLGQASAPLLNTHYYKNLGKDPSQHLLRWPRSVAKQMHSGMGFHKCNEVRN